MSNALRLPTRNSLGVIHVRVLAKLVAALLLLMVLYPPVILCHLIRFHALKKKLIQLFYALVAKAWRIEIIATGTPSDDSPLLVMANHSTYLDIIVLGALMPVSFTPKTEIAGWPVIGYFARLTGSYFVDRSARKAKEVMGNLREVLTRGERLCIFPEATTGDGIRLLPFKSAPFSLAEPAKGGRPVTLQPVAVAYTRVSNMPIDYSTRSMIAWCGDEELVPHLINLLKLGKITVRVHFLPAYSHKEFGSRKELTLITHQAIEEAHQQLMRE